MLNLLNFLDLLDRSNHHVNTKGRSYPYDLTSPIQTTATTANNQHQPSRMISLDIGELKKNVDNNNASFNASRRTKAGAGTGRVQSSSNRSTTRRRISLGLTATSSDFGDSDIFVKNSNITPRSQIDFLNNTPGSCIKNSKVPLFSDLPEVHKPVGERTRSPGGSSQASNSVHSESDFRAFLDDQAFIHFLI